MYRLGNILKDTYITNKLVAGSGSITSNVGQAATLDLFKIYTSPTISGSSATVENSRILIQPDLTSLTALTSSCLDIRDSSFKAYLSIKDVYGGQTTPSNFTVSLLPLAKAWDEGRGIDVRVFRDLDTANWLTASAITGTPVLWAVTGANSYGNLGDNTVDVWVSGNLGAGSRSLEVAQTFLRGDENMLMDVTTLVSATIAGIIPNNGWRLSFSGTLETDTNSYFVKRFGSRHTTDHLLHPKLIFVFDESLQDDGNDALLGVANTIRTYNNIRGQYTNFVSASSQVTGTNCAKLVLVASKSINVFTSSFQQNFSASLTYLTSSTIYYSSSFSASQATIGTIAVQGYYLANVTINPQTDVALQQFLSGSESITFQSFWKSNDGTVLYSSGAWIPMTQLDSGNSVITERNFVVNVTNLKTEYVQTQTSRMRVFVQDRNTELPAFRLPMPTTSLIFKTMYWRLLNAFTREIVVPFSTTGTRLSSDGLGMYFDMYVQDLDTNTVYELEFQITENNRDYFIANEGFRFKVVP